MLKSAVKLNLPALILVDSGRGSRLSVSVGWANVVGALKQISSVKNEIRFIIIYWVVSSFRLIMAKPLSVQIPRK